MANRAAMKRDADSENMKYEFLIPNSSYDYILGFFMAVTLLSVGGEMGSP